MKFHKKSLRIHVNVFANKLKVVQHRDHKQFADVVYYGLYDKKKKSQTRIYIQQAFRKCILYWD